MLDELRRIIAIDGPIPVERYMALCLGHPGVGYYMTRDPLGVDGDFTTAPEISQMFGELLGLFAAQCWLDLGSPHPVRLVEFGPGRGTLMADALRAAKALPGFREGLNVELVETSPVLRAAQAQRLAESGVRAVWRRSVAEIEPGEGPVIAIGNEFLDALPIRQFVRQQGAWRERLVGLSGDTLAFGLAAEPEMAIAREAPEGAVLEAAVVARGFVGELAALLLRDGGVALFIDYGHARSGFGDTLQAVRRHEFVDPLAYPGESDLTAHIDFAGIARAALDAGLIVHGPVEQGPFLERLGLDARADQLIRGARSPQQADAVKGAQLRLTGTSPTGMGRLFKAIALCCPGQRTPPGFEV